MGRGNRSKQDPPRGTALYPFEMIVTNFKDANVFVTNHWHHDIEILYVVKGELYITINYKEYIGHEGDIFFVNKGEMHELYSKQFDLFFYAFVFNADFLDFKVDDTAQTEFVKAINNGDIIFDNYIPANEEALKVLNNITSANTMLNFAYMLETKADLLKFMSILLNKGLYKRSETKNTKNGLLKDIALYVDNYYSEKLTLDSTAKKFNMTPKSFCRFFKNNFHKTFIEYVNDIRISKAMTMLENGNTSVTDIAFSCGFSNMSYFTKVFKSTVGFTPLGYKKHISHYYQTEIPQNNAHFKVF